MASGWSNEETFKFIELYHSCPEIWNPRHKCHKDKNKINDAWTRIAEEMQVPVAELKKKQDTLLAAFRANHKKVIASQKSGAGENEFFKPIWVFYEAMAAFMTDVYESKSILTTEDSADAKENADDILDEQQLSGPQEPKNSSQGSIPAQKRRCSKPPELTETSAHIKSALCTLNDVLSSRKNMVEKVVEDDCDLYGRLLAKDLRNFNELERLELRHEIDALIIKKKRLLASRCYVSSPSQIIITTNRPSTSHSTYSELLTDDSPSSPYIQHRPSSSRSTYSSPSPVCTKIQTEQHMSHHVYAVDSPSQTTEGQRNMSQHVYTITSPPDNQSSDILHEAYSNAMM